ncbi:MAG TPA: DNA polymerase III subunit alpha, partial [Alphaproteobacteria bacterium]|nr:DNA polymerase III subunit alpha [Alphaproteobacteria bacterium]
ADDPAAAAEAGRVAAACRCELDLDRRKLPRFALPPGETAAAVLRRLARRGLRRRLAGDVPAERRRAGETLERELAVVEAKDLADYFLVCWDIVRFARSRGMRSLGRGSAGNSIVSYALEITHVNPLRHDLFFERFLNPEREQLPDIDLDFATDDREEVLAYIFRRYGRDRVAMIGAFSTLRARAALRETAKALGIPEGETAPLIRRIPRFADIDRLEEVRASVPAAADLPLEEEPLRTLVPLAARIGRFPRHMSTHPCGLVVSPGPVTDLVPLQLGDRGLEVAQWSMYEIEEAGLLKIDVIGQKGLAVIQEAAAAAERHAGRPLHPERIDCVADPATRAAMRRGETEGCFYVESPIMIQLIRQARCDDFEVLTALSSIIRPGVSSHGGKQRYLRRHLGLEPVAPMHPAVAEVLADTRGVLIYQEQVIRIAVAVAGMSHAEADGLRRCMSFKSRGETFAAYRDSFLRGARRRGIGRADAEEIFEAIASFAGYAFCKAHSASFALESFESLYWKTHYPAEFMAAVLSNGGGYYTAEEYVEEARRMGLEILSPCVNRGGVRFEGEGRRLRVGLMQVKGLSAGTAERIVEGRPFLSLAELLEKTGASRGEAENLIRCGAAATLGDSRPALLWELRVLLSGEDPAPLIARLPHLPDYGPAESLAIERELLGLAVGAHPLAIFAPAVAVARRESGAVFSTDLPPLAGREAAIVGWKASVSGTRTQKTGEQMLFVTFSDERGRFEAIFFPRVYRRAARLLASGPGPFLVRGR